jgi:hypothetical protein
MEESKYVVVVKDTEGEITCGTLTAVSEPRDGDQVTITSLDENNLEITVSGEVVESYEV